MRRSDREVQGKENILDILKKCEIIRLGVCRDNKPYIVPMNFGFEDDGETLSIYMHCAKEGLKLDIILENSNVCFEADCSLKVTKGNEACEWSMEYESVIGFGEINIVDDAEQKKHGLNVLMKHYGFEGAPFYPEPALNAVKVLKITVNEITGKRRLG